MKRLVVLDTETTGVNIKIDRIIEIGCVEIINKEITGKYFHKYLKTETKISKSAYKVHGLKKSFFKNKPKFQSIFKKLLKFLGNSSLIIHNSRFDIKFLKKEFHLINKKFKNFKIIDTLKISRKKYPGKKNSLSNLCKRFKIEHENIHGALKDSFSLAKLFLALKKRQKKLPKNNKNSLKFKLQKNEIKAKIT